MSETRFTFGDTTYRVETIDNTGRPCAEWIQQYRLEAVEK